MKKLALLLLLKITFFFAQAPNIQWQKCYGGTGYEVGKILETIDGGYIIAGGTSSSDGDLIGNHSSYDCWLIKLNSLGDIEWQKTYGGTQEDLLTSIQHTNDGGYILLGITASIDGDITFNHGTNDCWVIKIDFQGNIQWQKTIGGYENDFPRSIQQTDDGGYIISIDTMSHDGDVLFNHGSMDYLVVKLNSTGTIEWSRTYGGSNDDRAYCAIKQTPDGGYIFGCESNSTDGDITFNHGISDYWIVKIDYQGNIEWQKNYGGSSYDRPTDIQLTDDGNYIISGITYSNDGDITFNNGYSDIWLIKIDTIGTLLWEKSFGGSSSDNSNNILKTNDGYIISGRTYSLNGDITGNHGGYDSWIIKLNLSGDLIWQKTLGGTNDDFANNTILTADGGYIVSGSTYSNDGDVTGNHGGSDCWVVKLSSDNLSTNTYIENSVFTLYPNPTKEIISLKLDYFVPTQEITITDILGKNIYKQKLNGLTTSFNVSSFEKGIYFLNLINGNQKTTQKFIIE